MLIYLFYETKFIYTREYPLSSFILLVQYEITRTRERVLMCRI